MTAPRARYKLEVAWDQYQRGLFTVGISTLDGPDVLAASSWSATFAGTNDDITNPGDGTHVDRVTWRRGRDTSFGPSSAGELTAELSDPIGKFNRKNTSSVLAGKLKSGRPIRLSAFYMEDWATLLAEERPLGWWRLNEPSGTVMADSSANGLTGSYIGGPLLNQTGGIANDPANRAVSFEGSLKRGSVPSSVPLERTWPFTVEVWVWPSPGFEASAQLIVAKGTQINPDWYLGVGPNGVVELKAAATSYVTGTGAVVYGAWNHVIATFDGVTALIWVNGALAVSLPVTGPIPVPVASTNPIRIGSSFVDTGFHGLIDEVVLYDKILGGLRPALHYAAGLGQQLRAGLFLGFIDTITHTATGGRGGTAEITANDFFTILDQARPVLTTLAETTGSAIGRILDYVQWRDPNLRSLARGDAITFGADGSASAMELIQNLLTAERGFLFIDGAGVVTYLDRNQRWTQPPQASIANVMDGMSTGIDRVSLKNRQRVTRTGGTQQTADDAASQNEYGIREADPIETPYVASDAIALDLARFVVATEKTPYTPIWDLPLRNKDDATLRLLLTSDLGHVWTVSEAETPSTGSYYVESLEHTIERGGLSHTSSYRLRERGAYSPFVVGVSVLDGTDVLAY